MICGRFTPRSVNRDGRCPVCLYPDYQFIVLTLKEKEGGLDGEWFEKTKAEMESTCKT